MSSISSSELLDYDFSPEVATQSQGLVLVLTNSPDDASFISKLLVQSGYQCVASHDMTAYTADGSEQHKAGDQYVATVLCHRAVQENAFVAPSPKRLPGERVIVMTDCALEKTAVSLFEGGAHHVFHLGQSDRLLQVRLEAALRKHSLLASSSFTLGDIHFDVPKRQVSRGGTLVDLSPKEYDLAYYLFFNRDRIVGNSELMTSIWSLPSSMDTRRIDTAACRLRKKLQLTADYGWELKRLRRVGYQLVAIKDAQIEPNLSASHIRVVAG